MCVISGINDPSKEVTVRFMRKSGQYFLLSKKLKKWCDKWNKRPFKGSNSRVYEEIWAVLLAKKKVEKVVPKVSNISQMLHTIH